MHVVQLSTQRNHAGLYWVRAASVRARAQSDYTTPVAVVVK
jgi:hypothetical protein